MHEVSNTHVRGMKAFAYHFKLFSLEMYSMLIHVL